MVTFLVSIGVVALATVLWLAHGVRRINSVSSGPAIAQRSGTAVLLIDLQNVFWTSDTYDAPSKERVSLRIIEEMEKARHAGIPILALRQEWSIPSTVVIAKLLMKGQAVAGTTGVELVDRFASGVDHVVVKRLQDGFETGELDVLLERLNIGHLTLAGLDGNYCVARTAQAALQRGYSVELFEDAILTADQNRFEKTRASLAQAGARLSSVEDR